MDQLELHPSSEHASYESSFGASALTYTNTDDTQRDSTLPVKPETVLQSKGRVGLMLRGKK
eukprot:6279435-Amphidinium_carterae.1